ncbi:MAG: phosphoribosylglycinamide formyltransferase [Synechococcaceae cyanobacterium SM2_3_1]|nr:phosphoribosylglycinamide formyltransferase [Synechococcaceae cyanobacterium SM2_3_1]
MNLVTSPLPNLAVLASGSGSNFAAIAQAIQAGHLHAQIQVLISNHPEAGVRRRAQHLQIPEVVINHRDFPTREDFDQKILETLQQLQVEWVILAGWMRRLTAVLVDAYPARILNIHPSLLPSFPGMHAVEQALDFGVKITGCTVHIVTLEVDAGPILKQAAVPVLEGDTPESLAARIQAEEHRIYPEAIAQCLVQAANGMDLTELSP